MPFTCSICDETATQICARCTKDVCANHICEKCLRCSDCCECEVVLRAPAAAPPPAPAVRSAASGNEEAVEPEPPGEGQSELP